MLLLYSFQSCLPACTWSMNGNRFSTKVLAPIEVPHHRDFTQHHSALRYWEAARSAEKVRTSSRPGEVTVLDFDGSLGQHCHHRLAVSRLKGKILLNYSFRTEDIESGNQGRHISSMH